MVKSSKVGYQLWPPVNLVHMNIQWRFVKARSRFIV